ncbi:peroxiredoxin family protein [Nocardia sp. NPDC051321]|uniref:peroxiredoxin family protein n=1 Tax=Nocardia sp. NPDC051321 TaxID=3364323 RepID=UPI0037B2847B
MSLPWIVLVVAQGIVLIILGLIVLGLLRRIGSVLEAVEAKLPSDRETTSPAVGQHIPPFVAVTAEGATVSSETLCGGPCVLLFVSPRCRHCLTLLSGLTDQWSLLKGIELVVITPDPSQLADKVGNARVVVDPDQRISQLFGVFATPAAIAIDAHRRVATPIQHVNAVHQLGALAEAARSGGTPVTSPSYSEEVAHA